MRPIHQMKITIDIIHPTYRSSNGKLTVSAYDDETVFLVVEQEQRVSGSSSERRELAIRADDFQAVLKAFKP